MKEKLLSVLIVLLIGSAAIAQEKTADTTGCDVGWLWEVSGNGLQQNSYLFGTCHGDGHQFTENDLFSMINEDFLYADETNKIYEFKKR